MYFLGFLWNLCSAVTTSSLLNTINRVWKVPVDRLPIGFCIPFLLISKYDRAFVVVLGKEKYITAEILADCGSNFESG
jgi:hypothetical protein